MLPFGYRKQNDTRLQFVRPVYVVHNKASAILNIKYKKVIQYLVAIQPAGGYQERFSRCLLTIASHLPKHLIKQEQVFYPFAAYMNHRKELTPFAVQDPGELRLNENLILKKYPDDKKN